MKFNTAALNQVQDSTKPRSFASFLLLVLLVLGPAASLQAQQASNKKVHVKFKEKSNPSVPPGKSARSSVARVDKVSSKHRASSIRRIFPDAGVFEPAHRAFGLHLWYEIELPPDSKVRNAVADYQETGDFDRVEESRPYTFVGDVTLPSGTSDPDFNKQWHYKNTGQTGGTPGADINLVDAWQKETGSTNVIVAVIDGGIDLNHPDLQGALWVNPGEIPLNGKDDDHNGYVDDVHGYGFGDRSYMIYPDDHGTHVAGTIGAASNNGIGVSGIAGGDGSYNGVRLMSCASFGNFGIGGFEEAMVYAADNGAVISQNSWGGGSSAIEAAIAYFIARAGMDNSDANFSKNIQTGPMAGGVVIFAAGNNNTSDKYYGYPGSSEQVIAVGSTDHNDVKSGFSNYGPWVDIVAPGTNVFSTKRSTYGGYGYYSGTSMACPHVSGVAALIVSNLQRTGLKPGEVWNRLRFSARSIDAKNPSLKGQLGWGRLDAAIALKEPDAIAPGAIADLQATSTKSTSIELHWTASGENGAEGQAAEYEIRYSTSPIDESNFSSATLVSGPPLPPVAGERVTFEIMNLTSATTYYVAIRSIDLFYNVSPLSNVAQIATLRPPEPELLTTSLVAEVFTGGISNQSIRVRNIGEEDLLVRTGIPQLQPAPVIPPLSAKGRLFGINRSKNRIEEINPRTGAVVHSVPMPEPSSKTVEGLAFDGTHLYYGRSKTIYKIDAATGEVLRTIFLSNSPIIKGLAWSGRYLYVSRYDGDRYNTLEVDTDTETVSKAFDPYSELAFLESRNSLLGIGPDALFEWDLSSDRIVKEYYLELNPKCVAFSKIDNLIFVSDAFNSSIRAINPADGSVAYTIPYPITTALAGDEGKLGWLESTGRTVSIPAGQTGELPVSFIAAGLSSSSLTGSVPVISMNSNTKPLAVPVSMTVVSGADIETIKELDFGTNYVGYPIDTMVVIENRGFADLTVSQIVSTNSKVTVSPTLATITPGQRAQMRISVDPMGTDIIDASITLTSNDPDEGTLSIPVRSLILEGPEMAVAPDSVKMNIIAGTSETQSITLTNTGATALSWNVRLSGTDSTRISQAGMTQSASIQQAGSFHKTDLGEITLKASSPESLTCLVYDPVAETIYAKSLSGNIFYNYSLSEDKWTAIGVTPSKFHGQGTYLNKKLYFGGEQLNVYSVQSGTWSLVPFPIGGEAISITNDDTFIYVGISKSLYRFDPFSGEWVELAAVPAPGYMPGFGALSFHSGVIFAHGMQGIFADGNTLFFKYFIETDSWFNSASISGRSSAGGAIDNSLARYFVVGAPHRMPEKRLQMSILDIRTGESTKLATPFEFGTLSGLVYVGKAGYSGVYLIQGEGNKFAYYETPAAPNWFTISPASGSLPGGESQTISVTVNAQSLFGGVYKGNIHVYSNRPRIEKNVPLQASVSGSASISFDIDSASVYDVVVGHRRTATVEIRNTGSAELVVSSITSTNADFSASTTSFRLPVGESTLVALYFTPSSIGSQNGTFLFHSNDPLRSETRFKLQGNGVPPAQLVVPTDTIKATLFTGGTAKKKFSISNIGAGSTHYLTAWGVENWIRIDSAGLAVNIGPGRSREFEARITAQGFSSGKYPSSIHIEDYLDPAHRFYRIPLLLEVVGAPDISVGVDSLNYGERFINGEYDTLIQVTNTGVLPLLISSIESDNPAFTVSIHDPMESGSPTFSASISDPVDLDPGASVSVAIRFNSAYHNLNQGNIAFRSNDPDESLLELAVKGIGVVPPKVELDDREIRITAFVNESVTTSLDLANQGGSRLNWRINTDLESSQGGTFVKRKSIPFDFTWPKLTAITSDATSGILYAQDLYYQYLYGYDASTNSWFEAGNVQGRSGDVLGGAVILNSKMYCTYSDNKSRIYVYDMILEDWTTRPKPLTFSSATITTDGRLLYLAGEGQFASYDPATKAWRSLPAPTFTLDGLGGLSYHNGFIYAHSFNGNGFARYNVVTGLWENLVPLPGKASLGSTVDPARGRVYLYGDNYLYEYDIATGIWTVKFVSLFKVGEYGGIAHLSRPENIGIYFTQGDSGGGFARYEPKDQLGWLRPSHLIGETESLQNQAIGINANATNLSPGLYHGSVQVVSNDPTQRELQVPVTFDVRDTSPQIQTPALLSGTFDRTVPTTKYLAIRNEGRDPLEWNIPTTLPSWLSIDKTHGDVMGQRVDSVQITFSPGAFNAGGVADFTVEVSSNDPLKAKVSTRLLLTIQNHQPSLLQNIPNQVLSADPLEIPLLDYFFDQDNDALGFSTEVAANSIVRLEIIGSSLFVKPFFSGSLTVTVTATDSYNSSVSNTFLVDNLVTGIQDEHHLQLLRVSPNPVESTITVHINNHIPGSKSIALYDQMGRAVTGQISMEEKQNVLEIDGRKLSPGLYLCVLSVDDKFVQSIRLIKR